MRGVLAAVVFNDVYFVSAFVVLLLRPITLLRFFLNNVDEPGHAPKHTTTYRNLAQIN